MRARLRAGACLLWGIGFAFSGCESVDDAGAHGYAPRPPLEESAQALTILPHVNSAPSVNDFVLYAEQSLSLGNGVSTTQADLGVRSSVPSAAPQLRIGDGDALSLATSLIAPSVSLGVLSTVGVVQSPTLTNHGSVPLSQAAFPSLLPALPVAPTATPGSTAVTVPAQQTRALAAGNYGAVNVAGTLTLAAGTYSFASLTLGDNASLVTSGSANTELRIAGTLVAGKATKIGPASASAAGMTLIEVSGATVTVGINGTVSALLTAPAAALSLGDGSVLTGALAANRISVGNNVALRYQTGFAPGAATGTPCALTISAQFPLPPLLPVVGVATLAAPLSFVVPATLPVTNGTLGISTALLTFSLPGQTTQSCGYAAVGVPVTSMGLVSCTGGIVAGSTQRAQSFGLAFGSAANLGLVPVTLSVALQAPASSCDDHNLCTRDACDATGVCASASVVCAARDPLHLPGTCAPSTGLCSNPVAPPPLSAAIAPNPLPAPPPPVNGCYLNTPDGWVSTACADPNFILANFPLPAEAEAGLSTVASGTAARPSLVYGQVETYLAAVGTTTDAWIPGRPAACPKTGSSVANRWSMQNNTNKFIGANQHQSAVQFAIQSNGSTTNICIWTVDVDAPKYTTHCVVPSLTQRSGGLRPFDDANVAGFVDPVNHKISMVAELSWVNASDATQYAVVTDDTIGLAGHWFEVSGSLLGQGVCSQLQLSDAELFTRLAASSCVGDTAADSPVCAGPVLNPNVTLISTGGVSADPPSGTQETNNLTPLSAPAVGFANGDLAIASYTSTTTGQCLGPALAYVKDRDDDHGGEPSNLGGEEFWESPDIFLVPHGGHVDPNAVASETLVTPGASFDVYVRVHNDLGCAAVTGAKALVYFADPSALSAQWTPLTGGKYSGGSASNGVSVPVGGQSLIGPFTFTAPTTGLGDGHKCLIAAVQANGEAAPANNFDAPASNQVAQRNVQFSNCAYPLTNATTSSGQVTLKLTVSPSTSKPSFTGTPDVEVTFDDPDASWFNVWHGDPAINLSYRLAHTGSVTTLRMGRNGVTLLPVPLAAGASRTARAVINLGSGDEATTLALQATLNDGTRNVVSNGGSCKALPPPVTQ